MVGLTGEMFLLELCTGGLKVTYQISHLIGFIVMARQSAEQLILLYLQSLGQTMVLVMGQQPSTSLTPEITTLWVMGLDLLVLVHMHL
jgi:hypothetical protein|tara:strand:+ start:884 stop:1147 length:264 start_codon:yes stop_codon:yes gene_type:complete